MPAILAIIVIALTLGYAGSHPDGMAPVAPSHSVSTPGDGCDDVNIRPGDHPYTDAEIAHMKAQSAAICRAITGTR